MVNRNVILRFFFLGAACILLSHADLFGGFVAWCLGSVVILVLAIPTRES